MDRVTSGRFKSPMIAYAVRAQPRWRHLPLAVLIEQFYRETSRETETATRCPGGKCSLKRDGRSIILQHEMIHSARKGADPRPSISSGRGERSNDAGGTRRRVVPKLKYLEGTTSLSAVARERSC